jgi:ABC-type sugar transport system ATPase subunit
MADRAAVLSHGKIEQIGSPLELFKKPSNEIVANAIGDPPINMIRSKVIRENDSIYLRGEGFSIKATGSLKERILRSGVNEEIELGIRPGDITVENDVGKGVLEAEVYVFEPLGGEAVATFSVRGKRVKATCSADRRLKIGQKVGLSFSLDNIHLFNPGTGEALASELAGG